MKINQIDQILDTLDRIEKRMGAVELKLNIQINLENPNSIGQLFCRHPRVHEVTGGWYCPDCGETYTGD